MLVKIGNLENNVVNEGGGCQGKIKIDTWWTTKAPASNHGSRNLQGI